MATVKNIIDAIKRADYDSTKIDFNTIDNNHAKVKELIVAVCVMMTEREQSYRVEKDQIQVDIDTIAAKFMSLKKEKNDIDTAKIALENEILQLKKENDELRIIIGGLFDSVQIAKPTVSNVILPSTNRVQFVVNNIKCDITTAYNLLQNSNELVKAFAGVGIILSL